MADTVITCKPGEWTFIASSAISFQILNDREVWYTKNEGGTPIGIPPNEEPANKALPGKHYNYRPASSLDALYVYTKPNDAVNIAVNSPIFTDIFIQDQSTPAVEHFLSFEMETVTIQANILTGEHDIILNAGAGSGIVNIESNAYHVEIRYVDQVTDPNSIRFYQSEIITYTDNVTSVTVEMDTPLDFDLNTIYVESAFIVDVNAARVSIGATVDDRKRMRLFPPDNLSWDITRIMITGVMESTPDDGKYFGGTVLTWGIFFGFENIGVTYYLANIKSNAGFRASAYDVRYETRTVPQGTYGMSVRKSFGGQDKYGVVVRLDGITGDNFVAYLQEDSSDNATDYRFKIMGHIVD